MAKGLMNQLRENLYLILALLLLAGGIYYFMSTSAAKKIETAPMVTQQQMAMKAEPAPVGQTSMTSNVDYTETGALSGSDLLPKDSNSEWNNLNVEQNSNGVVMPDMLQAGVHQGLDTVGSVLRNANQQLRPDPVIPKSNQGLCNINMSTIEPDAIRGDLKVGC